MTEIPGEFSLPRTAFERQRSILAGHVEAGRADEPSRGRRFALAVAVVALAVVMGTATALGVRAFILDKGFVGLPPKGATPSTPDRGELVLHWLGRSATRAEGDNAPLMRVWVYADGRIIWSLTGQSSRPLPERATELTSGYLEQRLTPEGVELLRSAVTDLFDRSRDLVRTRTADDPEGLSGGPKLIVPLDHRSSWGYVELSSGDRLIGLSWDGPDAGERFGGRFATPEQLSALGRVDVLLTDPESVLPSSAWAVRKIRAYVPSHYQVCMDTSPPKDVSQILSWLPAEAAEVLHGKSLTGSEGDVVEAREAGHTVVLGRTATYCAKLTTEEAREVTAPLSGFDQDEEFSHGLLLLAYRLAEPVGNLPPTRIWFEPYFPHGQVTNSAGG